jgi:hypothetical protein
MEKKRKVKPFVILFLVVLFALNLIFFLRDKGGVYNSITGMFIKDIPIGINMSLIAFIAQWLILLLVIILAYTKFLKHRKQEQEKIENFAIPRPSSKAETNMDVFYNLLKEKKSLSVGATAKAFNISKEKALEWAKILEDHDLATIEYPTFSDAEIKIKGYDLEKKKEKLEKQRIKEKEKQKKDRPS